MFALLFPSHTVSLKMGGKLCPLHSFEITNSLNQSGYDFVVDLAFAKYATTDTDRAGLS